MLKTTFGGRRDNISSKISSGILEKLELVLIDQFSSIILSLSLSLSTLAFNLPLPMFCSVLSLS